MPIGRFFTAFRGSFRFRLFLLFTLLTALITTAFFSFYVIHEIRSLRGQLRSQASLLAELLANNLRLPLYADDRKTVQALAESTAKHPGVRGVTIMGITGVKLVDVRMNDPAPSGETIDATADVTSGSLYPDPETALLGSDFQSSRLLIGRVRLNMDTSGLGERVHALAATSVATGFAFWLLASLFGFFALRRLTRSFHGLMDGVRLIEAGDYVTSIPDDSADEPGRAARAINALAVTLQCRERENKRLQEELLNAMRLEVQEEKKQLMARLIQTNRMTSLGLLVASMSHEINNPNATISLSAHYLAKAWRDALPLLKGLTEEEGNFCLGGIPFSNAQLEVEDCAAKILSNTGRIAKVVQDLRAYALGFKNTFTTDVDLNGVVSSALAIIRCQIRQSDVHINVRQGENIPLITANSQQLEQVVVNVLLNALQASPADAGDILISTSFDPDAGEVLITICDQGEGIPREAMAQLVEPFFSTRIDQGGSGLGLYISNYIISEHKGKLEFESTPGMGTTVWVRLPVAGGANAEPMAS